MYPTFEGVFHVFVAKQVNTKLEFLHILGSVLKIDYHKSEKTVYSMRSKLAKHT